MANALEKRDFILNFIDTSGLGETGWEPQPGQAEKVRSEQKNQN
jgi:hypothetical protein